MHELSQCVKRMADEFGRCEREVMERFDLLRDQVLENVCFLLKFSKLKLRTLHSFTRL